MKSWMLVVASVQLYFRISKKPFHKAGNASADSVTTSSGVTATLKLPISLSR
ncbi:hypothetical protein HanHA89_Chr14g0541941 [Helianthus annuus]|nr:hypothetical protein HanHA89_Chr14g0541941 [Helianthus annuus]